MWLTLWYDIICFCSQLMTSSVYYTHTATRAIYDSSYQWPMLHISNACYSIRSIIMKALTKKHPKQKERSHYKSKGRSPYIYCRTKSGPRIIVRRKPRVPFKFVTCSVSIVGQESSKRIYTNDRMYDSDSYNIGIDDHASYCLTNSLKDFIDTPISVKVRVKVIKGTYNVLRKEPSNG